MIRIGTFFMGLLCCLFATAQDQTRYLFVTKDSLLQGVKNQSDEIIIAAQHPHLGRWSAGELITDSIIDFYGLPEKISFGFDSTQVAYTTNTTFDRDGKVLYHPFFFDNGADYIQEGARRFVDIQSRKMGLIHPYGNILIPAQYDFLTALHGGYMVAYNGVKRKTEAGGEHWSIVADTTQKYERIVLNRFGETVVGSEKLSEKARVQLFGDTLFYPDVYAVQQESEKVMLDRLAQSKDVDELFRLKANASKLVIIERPSSGMPYYVVGCVGSLGFDYILVDRNEDLFYFDYYQPKIKLATYVENQRNGNL